MKQLILSVLLLLSLAGCAQTPAENELLFDGTFANLYLQQSVSVEEEPVSKDEFLTLWRQIPQEERTELVEAMDRGFADKVISACVYLNEDDRFTFAPCEDAYTVDLNGSSTKWNLTRDELLSLSI